LLKGVYEPNMEETNLLKPVQDFIKENGNYKKEKVKLFEIFENTKTYHARESIRLMPLTTFHSNEIGPDDETVFIK
jgi:hypothetical protein